LRETQQQLQEALLKISKLEDSNTALKTDLKLAREKLRGQAKGGLSLGRIVNFFWWFGGQLTRWGRSTILFTSKKWRKFGIGIFFVVVFYTTWRFFYRTSPSSIPRTRPSSIPTKATTTIHKPGEDRSRFVGKFFRGILNLLLE